MTFGARAVVSQPIRNGMLVIIIADFLPRKSTKIPERRAPKGVEITPKLAKNKLTKNYLLNFINSFKLYFRIGFCGMNH